MAITTTVDNAAGTIDPGDALFQLSSATINGGTLLAGQVDVTGSSSLNGVTSAANVDLVAGATLFVRNLIDNTGTVTVNSNGSNGNSVLNPESDVIFDGDGTIVLNATSEPADAQIGGATNDFVITQGGDHAVRGGGQIINPFVNNGLVIAESGDQPLLLTGGIKTNSGELAAAAPGTLQITTTVNNASGTITPGDGLVRFHAATINGGTVSAGQVDVVGNSILNGITTDATIDQASGVTVGLLNTITNNGVLTVNSNGGAGNSVLDPNNDVMLAGTGEIVLNATSQTPDAQIGGATNDFVITQGDHHTIRGSGQIINPFVNNGLILADAAIQPLALVGGLKTNNATLAATGDGVLLITATTVNNANGVIDPGTGLVQVTGSTLSGGTLAAGQIDVIGNSTFNSLTTNATIDQSQSTTLAISGTITNNGTITVNSQGGNGNAILDPNSNVTLGGTGTVVLKATTQTPDAQIGGATNDFAITQAAGHTIRGSGQIINPFVNNGLIVADSTVQPLLLSGGAKTNNGTFAAGDGATLRVTAGGTTFANNGTLLAEADSVISFSSNVTGSADSTLAGDGTIASDAGLIVTGGMVLPGSAADPFGDLRVEAELQLTDTSLFGIEIGGTVAAAEYDQLDVTQTFLVDGVLAVALLNGFVPDNNDTFVIATAVHVTGEFDNVSDGDTILTSDGRGTFVVDYNDEDIVLSGFIGTPIPEPSSVGLLAAAGGMLLTRRRNRRVA